MLHNTWIQCARGPKCPHQESNPGPPAFSWKAVALPLSYENIPMAHYALCSSVQVTYNHVRYIAPMYSNRNWMTIYMLVSPKWLPWRGLKTVERLCAKLYKPRLSCWSCESVSGKPFRLVTTHMLLADLHIQPWPLTQIDSQYFQVNNTPILQFELCAGMEQTPTDGNNGDANMMFSDRSK